MTNHPDPIIANVERKLTDFGHRRDAAMGDAIATGRWGRVRVLEAYCALQQTILAGLVEQSDPERAARLRAMAASLD